MTHTPINFEEDAIDRHAPSDTAMRTVSALCQRALDRGAEATLLEAQAKELRVEERRLLEQEIPDAMLSCGLSAVTLDGGTGVTIKDIIQASPKAADREWVYGWLREHGLGDLIKNEVTAKFGAGDEALADAAALYLEEQHFAVDRKETVHPQTLSAQVRKWIRGEEPYPCDPAEFPEEKFGVFVGRRAEIK